MTTKAEEELRRRVEEEEEGRRRRIEEELRVRQRQQSAPLESPLESSIAEDPLLARVNALSRSYFTKAAGIGAIVGTLGGVGVSYFMERYHNSLHPVHPTASSMYLEMAVTTLLCAALGVSIGAFVANEYSRRKMEKGAGEHTEGEDEERGGR